MKPTNKCPVLVGEQSNAYRILLRYDRKSRHRRIKKQRRYERLAATSQLSLWSPCTGEATPPDRSCLNRGLAATHRVICGPPGPKRAGGCRYPPREWSRMPAHWRCRPGQSPARTEREKSPRPSVTFLAPLASNFEGLKDR